MSRPSHTANKQDLNPKLLETIEHFLRDATSCATHLGLEYWTAYEKGIQRKPCGDSFCYFRRGHQITNIRRKKYYDQLGIPPAWQNVFIAPLKQAHLLSLGNDDAGRKQYLYHPKWVDGRSKLHFYELLNVYPTLSKLREWIAKNLESENDLLVEYAVCFYLLDTFALRVGSERYYERNNTVGLTTIRMEHITIQEGEIEIKYQAKSQKERTFVIKNDRIISFISEIEEERKGAVPLFPDIDATALNDKLHEITGQRYTVKAFRTWHGTQKAYTMLCQELSEKKAYKKAAQFLSNTPAVAKASYVHPEVVQASKKRKYKAFFKQQKTKEAYEKQLYQLIAVLAQEHLKL
ncbi:hypothetical protein [Aureispira sp. CCB-E]|uniref:hypothetical protein n=1 Tax=Aureispira sp. CCB-E TaxID=3051121 RepID=UPI002868F6B5|nr:hypothetical protein [Aureispira sp. CCB-E]WMX12659.1 hypothetical protein QP953_17650 [Aureispira sp. CCB-E]